MEGTNKEYIEKYLPAIVKNFDLKNPSVEFDFINGFVYAWCNANYCNPKCLGISILYVN